MIVGIDPGENGLALALMRGPREFVAGAVVALNGRTLAERCYEARHAAGCFNLDQVYRCVVEEMIHYPKRGATTAEAARKAADLLHLQALGAWTAAAFHPSEIVYRPAREWKGAIPDAAVKRRIQKRVTAESFEAIEACAARYGARAHNLWDAVGLVAL